MKKLLIMRHAKSDKTDLMQPDIQRPLNERGKMDAPRMGREIKKLGCCPDLIITSPAIRAYNTAIMVAENCGYNKELKVEKVFYFGNLTEIIEVVKQTPDDIEKLLIFGHNPTWEELVYLMTKKNKQIEMPTAALVSLTIESDSWKQLKPASCDFEFVIIPKAI